MKWISLFFLLLSLDTFSYINLYPTTFNKRIDGRGASEEFVLSNPGSLPVKYRIYAEGGDENISMLPWIEIYPQNITLKSGEEKRVKLYIKAPASAQKGEYGAIIGFREIYVPDKIKSDTHLKLLTDLKLHITGYVGDLAPVIESENIEVSSDKVLGLLKNSGTRRADVEIYLAEKSEKNMYFLGSAKIKRNSSFDLANLGLEPSQNRKNYDRIRVYEKPNNRKLGEFIF